MICWGLRRQEAQATPKEVSTVTRLCRLQVRTSLTLLLLGLHYKHVSTHAKRCLCTCFHTRKTMSVHQVVCYSISCEQQKGRNKWLPAGDGLKT